MEVSILGRATARPRYAVDERDATAIAARLSCRDARDERLLRAIFRQTRIRARGSVLLSDDPAEIAPTEQIRAFYPDPVADDEAGPPTSARMTAYRAHAGPLAARAAQRALDAAEVAPAMVAQVIAVSCTGLGSPGLDIELVERLGLSPGVGRTLIGFMGCHGAINGLRVARALALAEPGRPVLLCAVELCSLHYQYGREPQKIVANALFNDGAAAAVLQADASAPSDAIRVRAAGCCLLPDSADAMTWHIGDHGFEMTLSARIPELIESHLEPWLRGWLAEHDLVIDRVGSWAIHPGGPRVLDAAAASLGLTASQIEPSREVLAECGNMSSPTVLFILERLRERGAPNPTVMLAFGPGLIVEAALLE